MPELLHDKWEVKKRTWFRKSRSGALILGATLTDTVCQARWCKKLSASRALSDDDVLRILHRLQAFLCCLGLLMLRAFLIDVLD